LHKCSTDSGSRDAARLRRIGTFLSIGSRYAASAAARTPIREEVTRTRILPALFKQAIENSFVVQPLLVLPNRDQKKFDRSDLVMIQPE
jgi:hypothetical protein